MKKELFADKGLNEEIERCAQLKKFSAGEVIIHPGEDIRFIPIVVAGALRVMLEDKDGSDYFLYHIYPGETCAVSLSCCLSKRISEVKALAEEDAEVLFIPVGKAGEWIRFPEWIKYVSDTQAGRFSELLETIGLIAFSKLDEQLWNYLVRRVQATGSTSLAVTHQEIATELHSPREVITRLLNKLQEQKKVKLSRNRIDIISLV